MNPKTKVIIIGIDGGTWTLLKPWTEKGVLPTFQKIMEKGAYGILMSSVPCRSGTAIPTFYTGKNHCKWGGFDFPSFDPDIVIYEKIKEKTLALWDILGKFGCKSAILNLPTTHPPTPTEGVMISGFNPSEEDEYAYPKDFKEKVKGFHAARETFLKLVSGKKTMENEIELFNVFKKSLKDRAEIIKNVIKDEVFNFSIFWIDESDSIQHGFWGQEKFLLDFFQEIDNILRDTLENNPNSNVIIMSDHGFATHQIYEFYPKTWLKKEGYLKLRGGRVFQWLVQAINSLVIEIPFPYRYRYIGFVQFIIDKIKNKIAKKVKKENKEINLENRNWRLKGNPVESKIIGIDWKKTIAINHDFWGIKIIRENLGRDYEKVRHEIMEKMKELSDKKGEKIIKYLWKREEIFSGNDLQKFPDIVYLPNSKFLPTGFLPFYITKNKVFPPKIRTSKGAHMTIREGIFLAMGPDVNNAGDIGEIDILDLAPTILHVFKVPVPEDMDGRVLKEILIV